MLTVEEQIEHLKSKGVTFELCSEEDAAQYLSERTYFFKIAAYRALFEKRIGGPRDGQYANLDFGHLKALASLDRDLRYALLPLTLDVEHAAGGRFLAGLGASSIPQACGRGYEPRVCHLAKTPASAWRGARDTIQAPE